MTNEPKVVKVNEAYRKFSAFFAGIGMFAIGLMGLSTSVDVIKRWITGWPIGGVMQLSECLMVVLVFLGVGFAQAYRRHIRVTFLVCRMKQGNTVRMDIISCLIQIILITLLTWKTLEEALWSWSILEYRVGDIRLPIYWARTLIPIGLAVFIGQLILDIWVDVERLKGRFPLELPDVRRIEEII